MDLETRLLWCMEKLQGFNRADLVKRPHPGGGQPVKDLGAIATYVANKSSGMKFAAKLEQPKEKERWRSARRCSTAARARSISPAPPATPTAGKRIRLQGLPYLSEPEEAQQGDRRMAGLSGVEHPRDDHAAPAATTATGRCGCRSWRWDRTSSVALIAYLTKTAEGGEIAAPGLKR